MSSAHTSDTFDYNPALVQVMEFDGQEFDYQWQHVPLRPSFGSILFLHHKWPTPPPSIDAYKPHGPCIPHF